MTVKRKVKRHKRKKSFTHHLVSSGFNNRPVIYILLFLAAGLAGGSRLTNEGIRTGYAGALTCRAVVLTSIGTACSIVPSKIVHKGEAEDAGGNRDSTELAMAMSDAVNNDGSS